MNSHTSLSRAALLDVVRAALTTTVPNLDDHQADAVTLWVAATHAIHAWQHAPRLLITSHLPASGKTRLLTAVAAVSCRPVPAAGSVAALYRAMQPTPPTLFLDQVDQWLNRPAGIGESLRSLLVAGFSATGSVARAVTATDDGLRIVRDPVYGMAAMTTLAPLPDVLTTRSVVIRLSRADGVRSLPPVPDRLPLLAADLHAWLRRHHTVLPAIAPPTPLTGRAADVWRPLLAVADLAGGHWPGRAAAAITAASDHAAA